MELRQANKEGTGIKKHGRGGSMACPVLFRRYLILLKSPGRVWEAHLYKTSEINVLNTSYSLNEILFFINSR